MNYFVLSLIDDERMTNYITRRSDLFNTLASTGASVILGLISGLILQNFILHTKETRGTYMCWPNYYFYLYIAILIVIFIIFINMYRIWKETDSMVNLLITFDKNDRITLDKLLGKSDTEKEIIKL